MAQFMRSMLMRDDTEPDSFAASQTRRRRRYATIGTATVAVALVHGVLGLWLGHLAPEVDPAETVPSFVIDLIPVAPPVEPVPDMQPSPSQGGGAPAARSSVRITPPREAMPPPEVVAPPIVAPEPPKVIGIAETQSPLPGQGQGGEGTGTGRGQGSGSGDGQGTGPRLIRGPTREEIRSLHPREAFRRRQGGQAQLICRLRADTRLEACRIVSETPQNAGFGAAALAAAQYFRFRPASREGHPVDGAEIAVGVEWP